MVLMSKKTLCPGDTEIMCGDDLRKKRKILAWILFFVHGDVTSTQPLSDCLEGLHKVVEQKTATVHIFGHRRTDEKLENNRMSKALGKLARSDMLITCK